MGSFVLDSFVDAQGTLATAHTPEAGGPIIANAVGSAAVITNANRMRGNGANSSFLYTSRPATMNCIIEASVYCASNVNGFGLCLRAGVGNTGYSVVYSAGTGNLVLSGGGLSPVTWPLSPTVGQRNKLKFQANAGNLRVFLDGSQIFNQNDTGITIPGQVGFTFAAQDTDNTGFQLDGFVAYDLLPTVLELSGKVVCDRGSFLAVNTDNMIYLVNLTDLITGAAITGATVTAQIIQVPTGAVLATISLLYVAGSVVLNGVTYTGANYRGQFAFGAGVALVTDYNVVVVAVSGSNQLESVARLPGQYD